MLHIAVQCSVVSTMLHNVVNYSECSAAQYMYSALFCIKCCTIQCSMAYTVLHNTVQCSVYSGALHCPQGAAQRAVDTQAATVQLAISITGGLSPS